MHTILGDKRYRIPSETATKNHPGTQAKAHNINQGKQSDKEMYCRIILWLPSEHSWILSSQKQAFIKKWNIFCRILSRDWFSCSTLIFQGGWEWKSDTNEITVSYFLSRVRQKFSNIFKYIPNFKHLNSLRTIFCRTPPEHKTVEA